MGPEGEKGTAVATTENPTRDIHDWFGLTYANYLVLPRTLLQSMPDEWQHRFVAMLDELDEAFAHVEQAEVYDVVTGVEREVGDLSDSELAYLGISREEEPEDEEGEALRPQYFYNKRGDEMQSWERIVWPTPDPIPHYNRGRTHVEPRFGDQP